MVERPAVIYCQFQLADDQPMCGVPRETSPHGNLPKYCAEHSEQQVRTKLLRAYKRGEIPGPLAEGESTLDESNDAPAEGEQEPGEAGESLRVCRARSCSIPLDDAWTNEFCPAHWRRLSVEARGNLTNSTPDPDLHEVEVLRALREISRFETGVDSVTGRP